MIYRMVRFVLMATILLVVCAGVGLSLLRHSVGTHREYWQAREAEQGELLYIAMGDSAAQGVGSYDPDKGYVGRLADAITNATGRKVRVINLSVSGATVQDVLTKQVPQLDAIAGGPVKPDFVTLDVGANDVVHGTQDSTAFRADYERILQALPAEQSVIADVPYFGGRIRADDRVQQANRIIDELAVKYGIAVAPLYDQLKPRQSPLIYATDLFHPNARGYAIWYDAFWLKIQAVVEAERNQRIRPVTDQPIPLPPATKPMAL